MTYTSTTISTLRSAMAFVARMVLVLVIVSAGFVWIAIAEDNAESDSLPTRPLAEGESLFQTRKCGLCHAIGGKPGESHIGPDLGRDRSWHDAMEFSGSLWNHAPAMAEQMQSAGIEHVNLSPDAMRALAAYLFSFSFLDERGDVARGQELFDSRSCSACHQFGGRGGRTGPRLDELKSNMSSIFLAQALWNHGPGMAAKMDELKITRPLLAGNDVADLVAYIRGEAGVRSSGEDAAALVGNPRAGHALFRARGCIQCHSVSGSGGKIGPDLGARRTPRSIGETVGAFWNHGPSMWAKMKEAGIPFPQLSDRDMADLLGYLYFLQFMAEGGDADLGARVFENKLCAHCHAAAGKGERTAPDLFASGALQSPAHWASAMWNHPASTAQKLREDNLEWPRFADDEMRNLVQFLRTRGDAK